MKTAAKIEKLEWLQRRRAAHHAALETIAGNGVPGLTLWRQLRRVENWLTPYSVRHCNGGVDGIDGDQWDAIKEQGKAKITKIFGGIPSGFFINSDPRGHALKLDCDVVPIPSGMERDWGGNGILAAEIN